MATIERSSDNNTFEDGKLSVKTQFALPLSDILNEDQRPGSIALNNNDKLIYKDNEGQTLEVLTSIDIEPFLKREDVAGLFPVEYIQPTLELNNLETIGSLEIGQTINLNLEADFIKNDAGNLETISIKKNNTTVSNASIYSENNIKLTATPIEYKATATYLEGPIKNNVINVPFPEGKIVAGTINSNILIYRGYYLISYGPVNENPTTSAGARTIGSTRLSNAGNTFILNTGTETLKQAIIVSPDKTLSKVVDLDALNQDITSQYILVNPSFSVNDFSGIAVSNYKLYVRTQGVAYTTNHRHQITLS